VVPTLTPRQALLVLNALPQVGPISVNRLLAACAGDPNAALTLGGRADGFLRPPAQHALATWSDRFDPFREEARLAELGAAFLIAADGEYPRLLKEIGDPPPGLYRLGRLDPVHPAVGIVGTRRASAYGEAVARRLGADLARAGCTVVSGLALGIDTAAHRGAVEAGGASVAVLGTGIDIVYPDANRDLADSIVRTGALVSEFPLGRAPDKVGFVRRNRIISGLCSAIVVVESDADGGAMITAKFAGEQGRTVCAVPGRVDQPASVGCHQLIRDGATLVTNSSEVIGELGAPIPLALSIRGLTPAGASGALPADEQAILHVLDDGSQCSLDALSARTGLPVNRLAPAVMALELNRLIRKRTDGCFERLG
jgi:DNA processing protein